MPWCDRCSRYYTPSSLPEQGTCPHCGAPLTGPGHPGGGGERPPGRPPWHFWLLVAGVVAYLGWRAVQGIAWVVEHL